MHPKISIITPSYNQGLFIEETIKSVFSQDYTNFEHIVIDGGSTDDTLDILRRYPHLKIVSEPDSGQAAAVNKGLRMATGDIIGWLNSDDIYYPGVFKEIAGTIHPEKGPFIVMGRCLFVDENGKPTGKEHPSEFISSHGVIKIWKGYTIPQPAVFFHRHVYEKCGGLDEKLYFCLDYDLFVRYSRIYHFHKINKPFATYRLHSSSKTNEILQGELLEKSLEVSRRYWGSPRSLSYWSYLLSYLCFGGKLAVMSLKRLNRAERCFYERQWTVFLRDLFISFLLFPPVLFTHVIFPAGKSVFQEDPDDMKILVLSPYSPTHSIRAERSVFLISLNRFPAIIP